jgi:hypothetical protein
MGCGNGVETGYGCEEMQATSRAGDNHKRILRAVLICKSLIAIGSFLLESQVKWN